MEDGVTIRAFSHLEGCAVKRGAVIGPYARLRPDTIIEPHAHVGNFVELKATTLGAGAKAELLWYAARVVWIQVAAGSGVLIEHSSEAPSLRRTAKMSHGPRRQY